jgi:hypothetical protein
MLTEHERRVLQQIAHDLARDDPRLARSLSRPRDTRRARARRRFAILALAVAVVCALAPDSRPHRMMRKTTRTKAAVSSARRSGRHVRTRQADHKQALEHCSVCISRQTQDIHRLAVPQKPQLQRLRLS